VIRGASIPVIAMAAIIAFSGAFSLLIYLRRRRKSPEILSFAATCFVFCVYLVMSAGLASAGSLETGALWQRYQFCAILLSSVALLKFVDDFTDGRVSRWWFWFFTASLGASAVADALWHNDLLWHEGVPMIKRFAGPGGIGVLYNEVETGPLVDAQYLLCLAWFVYILAVTARFYWTTRKRRARHLLVSLSILFVCAVNDMQVSAHVYQFFYLIDYGYLAIVFLMAHSFIEESVVAEEAIRERSAMRERLREAEKQEAIGRLAGGVAHDLNNMLTPIIGYVDIARRKRRSVEELMEYLSRIGDAAEHSRRLTWQLLAFSRKQMLHVRVLELNAVVSSSEQMLRRLIPETVGLELRLSPEAGRVRADETQLQQILVNLAINARDAMPNGGSMRVETRVVRKEAGDYAVFAVKDTGHGMDEGTAARIFEPFFTTKGQGKGTGLGLSTVYGIVRQHEGTIEFDTAVGSGSEFRVFLPRVEEAAAPEPASVAAPPEPAAAPARGGKRLLVVEDEETVMAWLCEVLRGHGYEIVEARSPDEALELVARPDRPEMDLLLTDVLMPGMNGFQLHEQLEERVGPVPVLYTSGYSSEACAARGPSGEPYTLLQKPFSAEKVLSAIEEALARPPA
jgi:signal transduction histidine kinase/ActR/RegA family two-component response regulator